MQHHSIIGITLHELTLCVVQNSNYAVQDIRAEVCQRIPDATFLGFSMDSTATNRKAMRVLQKDDPNIVLLVCASHGLALTIKHVFKYFAWAHDVDNACCGVSEKLIKSSKVRDRLHTLQMVVYGAVK